MAVSALAVMDVVITTIQQRHILSVWLIRLYASHQIVAIFALSEHRV